MTMHSLFEKLMWIKWSSSYGWGVYITNKNTWCLEMWNFSFRVKPCFSLLVRYRFEHKLFSMCLRKQKGLNPSLEKNVFVYSRYNQLSALPTTLANCTKIDEFNIEGNNISELPVSGKQLLSMKCVPYVQHILNYFHCFCTSAIIKIVPV